MSDIRPIPRQVAIARAAHIYTRNGSLQAEMQHEILQGTLQCACKYNSQVQLFYKVVNAVIDSCSDY